MPDFEPRRAPLPARARRSASAAAARSTLRFARARRAAPLARWPAARAAASPAAVRRRPRRPRDRDAARRRSTCTVDWIDERESEFPDRRRSARLAARPSASASTTVEGEVRRRAGRRVLPGADARPRPRPAHRRGHPAPRRLRLPRPDRLEDQARALPAIATSNAASPPRRSRA